MTIITFPVKVSFKLSFQKAKNVKWQKNFTVANIHYLSHACLLDKSKHMIYQFYSKMFSEKMVKFSKHIPPCSRKNTIISITTIESWNLPTRISSCHGKTLQEEHSGIRIYLLSANLGVKGNREQQLPHFTPLKAIRFLDHLYLLTASTILTLFPFSELCSFLTCPSSLCLSHYSFLKNSFNLNPHEVFISYSGSFYLQIKTALSITQMTTFSPLYVL